MKRQYLLVWSFVVVGVASFTSSLLSPAMRAADRTDAPAISGTVSGEDGKPVSGAMVSISTAAKRRGTNPFCPSCYADCSKRAKTDAGGEFSIGSLDPTLVFRVLFVARGFEPKFVTVDPLKDKAIKVALKPRSTLPDDPRRIVSGQVVGPRGDPVAGAIVVPFGCKSGERRWWGSLPGVDPLTVTDDQGTFQIVAAQPVDGLDLEITARALAKKKFELIASAGKANRLQLSEGATVRGRVVDHGQAVVGVNVGLAQVDRGMNFLGAVEIGADEHGEFLFANVSANDDYYVYGIMSTLGGRGGISEHRIHVGGDGNETSVGDLAVEPAFRISGRIVLSDGKPLPTHTRVLLSREAAWDSQLIEADAEGAFTARGIPSGIISIYATVTGYRPSQKNKSLERLNGSSLKGLIEKDLDGLLILMEPGKIERSQWPRSPAEQRTLTRSLERLKVEPPMGVTAKLESPEPAPAPDGLPSIIELPSKPRKPLPKIDLSAPIREPALADADVPKRTVTGRVTDDSGQPVATAEVWLPVRWVPPNRYLTVHAKCGDKGRFQLAFPIEWLPEKATVVDTNAAVWAFAPGHSIGLADARANVLGETGAKECEVHLGPEGDVALTVLLPDGAPAVGARVAPAHYSHREIGLFDLVPPDLVAKTTATTDSHGRATLPAFESDRMDDVEVLAEGFGKQHFRLNYYANGKLERRHELRLVPRGRIEGRVLAEQRELFRNMFIMIETEDSPDDCNGVATPPLDEEGRFVIPQIAAGMIHINARIADERLPVRPRLVGRDKLEVATGKTTRLEIPLESAVRVRGVVRMKGTAEPIAGAGVALRFGDAVQWEQATTDNLGRYSALVLPGQVNMQVVYTGRRDATQLSDSRTTSVPVPDGVADFKLPPVELVKVRNVSGRLLDKEGKPLAKRRINGIVDNWRYGWGETNESGEFTLTGVPEEVKLVQFQVSSEPAGLPETVTAETTDPLLLRLK